MSAELPDAIPELTPDFELSMSNCNIPPIMVATAGIVRYMEIWGQIERGQEDTPIYAGRWDVTPTWRLVADALTDKGSFPYATRLHQTWPRTLRVDWRRERPFGSHIANIKGLAAMPEAHMSLHMMTWMSEKLGEVPLTVYPDVPDRHGNLMDFKKFGNMNGAQISPEVIDDAGSNGNMYLLPLVFHKRGIHFAIADTHHLQRASDDDENRRYPWQIVLDIVDQSHTPLMAAHVSAGRVDSTHEDDRDRSLTELGAILTGPQAIGNTVLGQILRQSYTIWRRQKDQPEPLAHHMPRPGLPQVFSVTTEIPYDGLVAHREQEDEKVSWPDYISMTRDIGVSLTEYLSSLQRAA